eukprot:1826145-Pyramimonas_sp.AAC.1
MGLGRLTGSSKVPKSPRPIQGHQVEPRRLGPSSSYTVSLYSGPLGKPERAVERNLVGIGSTARPFR